VSRLWFSDLHAGGGPTSLAARASAAHAAGTGVDLAPFVRTGALAGAFGGAAPSRALEGWVTGHLAQPSDPSRVPLSALRAMGNHPVVYLAERAIGGVVRRPDLYYVRHADKAVVREVEEWLWPLLPVLLGACARAFSYGSVPVVLDWGVSDLRLEVPRDAGGVRNKTLFDHVHYAAAHEVWPGDVDLEVDGDRLLAVRVGDDRYGGERAAVFRWDPEFGEWTGQGARRRAWRDFLKSTSTEVLQGQYLERSVDSPRVVWCPPGTVPGEGRDLPTTEYMAQLLLRLKGSGVLSLPSSRDPNGHKKYEIETLDLPDRKDVWNLALNRYDGGILEAFLVPPSLAGVEDLAATGARVLDGMLKEFIQDLATFAAQQVTALVRTVHAMNHDPARVPPPDVCAYEVPASIRKLYLEVLRLVGAANRQEAPADWVDVPALLDQLGVPLRTAPLPSTGPGASRGEGTGGPPGRPPDLTGGRDARRDAARTVPGDDPIGQPGAEEEP